MVGSDHDLVKTKNRSRNRSHKCDGIEESGAEAPCDWFSSFTFWDSDKPATSLLSLDRKRQIHVIHMRNHKAVLTRSEHSTVHSTMITTPTLS